MKILLDIDDQREQSFMELIKDLAEAFDDVKQYESGKKDLISAQDLLDEL